MRAIIAAMALVAVGVLAIMTVDLDGVMQWAVAQQRAFQNEMAGAVHGLRRGEAGAWATLLAAAGAYGFVHAVGPGHGKYLIGGVGLGSQISASNLFGVAIASSLAQAMVAILLVYGGFWIFEMSARQATSLAENWLAPFSYLAIALVGGVLAWRGVKVFASQRSHGDHHAHGEHDHVCSSCGHAHGPTPHQVAELGSVRELLALIASIAIRPCTGAVFLLVIAWQMDIQAAGAAAVLVMGLGTALLTSLVAASSLAARGLTLMSAGPVGALQKAIPLAQILVGLLILTFSLLLLREAML